MAESERTAIIFGMPDGAIRTGAVQHVLDLDEIASSLDELCHES